MSHWKNPEVLDRAEGRRSDPAWVESCWHRPTARVIRVDAAGRVDLVGSRLALTTAGEEYDPLRHHLLGLVEDEPVFAVKVETATSRLRTVLAELDDVEQELAFAAVGVVGWHVRAGYCGTCGGVTVPGFGGMVRTCPACGTDDYPRSDPAMIVAITDADDRLLLARHPSWAPGFRSVLAGFCETGESLEQTVYREVEEEVGLELGQVSYLGSQPWPFPRSLMVAFRAEARGAELHPADGEIEEAAWFSRAALRTAVADGAINLPSEASIARRMIEAWLAGDLSADGLDEVTRSAPGHAAAAGFVVTKSEHVAS